MRLNVEIDIILSPVTLRLSRLEERMIRFRLKERVADWEFEHGKKLTLEALANATNIHRTTLSKIANVRGYNTTTDNIDSICRFFECEVQELMEWVSDPNE